MSTTTLTASAPATRTETGLAIDRGRRDPWIADGLAGDLGESKLPKKPQLSFDVDVFEAEILKRLDGTCIGYAYAIGQGGQHARSGWGGLARTSQDGGAVDQSQHKRMNIASITKTLTATVAVRVLNDYGVGFDEPIKNYLPSDWTIDGKLEPVTFHHLLTHTSGFGFNNANTSYASMRDLMEEGDAAAQPPGPQVPEASATYDNRNLALFRILLPYIVCRPIIAAFENQGDAKMSQMTGELYVDLMRYFLFDKIAIQNAECKLSGPAPTLMQQWPWQGNPGSEGPNGGDWTELSGGGGWYLSAYELARILAYQRYTSVLLTPAQRTQMDANLYGWFETAGAHGTYLRHRGSLGWSQNGKAGSMQGTIMKYPTHHEAALLVNSNLTGGKTTTDILKEAYDAAWI